MPVATLARHIGCEGAFNLRDIGGYGTSSGRTVRLGVVYRADGLHRIPPGGASAIGKLGWRTVIDLRTTAEVAARVFRADGVEVINHPILQATWGVPDATDIDPVEFLSDHYVQMLDEGAAAIPPRSPSSGRRRGCRPSSTARPARTGPACWRRSCSTCSACRTR